MRSLFPTARLLEPFDLRQFDLAKTEIHVSIETVVRKIVTVESGCASKELLAMVGAEKHEAA